MRRSALVAVLLGSALLIPSQAFAWGRSLNGGYPPFSQTFVPLNTFYTPYPHNTTNMQWTPRPTGYNPAGVTIYSAPTEYHGSGDVTPRVYSSMPTVQYSYTPSYYYQPSNPNPTTTTFGAPLFVSPSTSWYWR